MAKLQYFDLLGDGSNLSSLYSEQMMDLEDEPSTTETAKFFDSETSGEIVFKGSEFSYVEGNISAGTVKSIQFLDSEGEKFAILKNLDADAVTLMNLMRGETGIDGMILELFKGDDIIFGSDKSDYLLFGTGKGNDTINGGAGVDEIGGGKGKDVLTGGKGNDFFEFFKGDGKDVITDFDAKGGEGKQDLILETFESRKDIKIEKHGHDVVIDFGDGSTLTLLDTKRSDISMDDFGNL